MEYSRKNADHILAKRYSYLGALQNESRPKCELEQNVPGSRSTLDRSLRDLADANLARYKDGVWKPTLLGKCSYRTRESYLTQLAKLDEASGLLMELPADSQVDCTFLAKAEIHETDPSIPDAIIESLLNCVRGVSELTIVTPVMVSSFIQECYEVMSNDENYSLELIFPCELFERTRIEFPTFTDELMSDPNVSLHTAAIPFRFGLWISDSVESGIIVFTDQGLQGFAVNDTEKSLKWAINQYESVKLDADPVRHRGRSETRKGLQ